MIPRLAELEPVTAATTAFLAALTRAGFSGDIRPDLATRLVTATDNSVYQLVPQAVVYPRSTADVALIAQIAAEPAFQVLTLAPRGGGTGTNGQSLSEGVIVDVSRHMNRILEVNSAEGWVRVQPGVVLDQLNRALKPLGVFFAPNLSPSSRATIGGMISTDACGEGSRVHGRTSEHVLELECVLMDGETFRSEALTDEALVRQKALPGPVGALHREVDAVVTEHADTITAVFPKLRRYMTGYNLALVRGARPRQRPEHVFDLNYLLCGSEGTLAFVTEATLRLTPLPTARRLVVLEFQSFDDALASAALVVNSNPSAIETIDEKVLGLARGDVVWYEVGHIFDRPERAGGPPTRAINLVQYEGNDEAVLAPKVQALVESVNSLVGQPGQPVGVYVVPNATELAALWNLRKKGVGLLGNAKGHRKPIPFVEDTVVPPERLREYVRDFRAILDAAGLEYGMFGHVDVGCLHVRPALDMKDPGDERLLRQISDRIAALSKQYGGVIWGEHGKGMRSEYNPLFFGETLFGALGRVKGVFDPDNRLNPGKLAHPPDKGTLRSIDSTKRGEFDRQIAPETREHFAAAIHCNGNGQCFDVDVDGVMCPSSKITRDRIHSPKGRAGVMREWLRQLARVGVDPKSALTRPAGWFRRAFNSLKRHDYDFSHEVRSAMDGCLACKACATQCPIQVDVPAFRSEFLALYHGRYLRPLSDGLVGRLESMLPLMAATPRLTNWASGSALGRRALAWAGLVDTPALSTVNLRAELAARGAPLFERSRFEALTEPERARTVFVMQDAFTTFYEPHVLLAVIDLVQAIGDRVEVLPFLPCGKGWHVKGFLKRFERDARRWDAVLSTLAPYGRPVIGVDPAVVLVFRDEIPAVLGRAVTTPVSLVQEWLLTQRSRLVKVAAPTRKYRLFGHCTERTAVPSSNTSWRQVFSAAGLELGAESVGCCGMCGAFGHEARHAAESRGIYALSWQPHLAAVPAAIEPLATGHSCRSQAHRCDDRALRHPAEALVEELRANAVKALPSGPETPL